MEIRADHPEALKQKILTSGITELEYWDKEHFYFQAQADKYFAWRARPKTCLRGNRDLHEEIRRKSRCSDWRQQRHRAGDDQAPTGRRRESRHLRSKPEDVG